MGNGVVAGGLAAAGIIFWRFACDKDAGLLSRLGGERTRPASRVPTHATLKHAKLNPPGCPTSTMSTCRIAGWRRWTANTRSTLKWMHHVLLIAAPIPFPIHTAPYGTGGTGNELTGCHPPTQAPPVSSTFEQLITRTTGMPEEVEDPTRQSQGHHGPGVAMTHSWPPKTRHTVRLRTPSHSGIRQLTME